MVLLATLAGLWSPWGFAADTAPPGERVSVSVKHVLDASGRRSMGAYTRDAQVRAAIGEANAVLERSGAAWRLELAEIVDVGGASERFDIRSTGELNALEAEARADAARYSWRDDAVNVFIVNTLPFRGACSFPGSGDIIAINNVYGFRNGGAGWLHEIGHFLSLTHTYECYSETGCDPDVCTGEAASHPTPRGRVRCADVCPGAANVMGHGEPLPIDAWLTPCQLAEIDYELHDAGGSRSSVLGNPPVDSTARFRRGDSDGDGRVALNDALATLGRLFLGRPPSACPDSEDVDDDGVVTLTDPIRLLGHLFVGDSPPPPPWGECGVDPTVDSLDCRSPATCLPPKN
jgi:hypothetical protein